MNYEELKEIAGRVIEGKARIACLDPEEEQGRCEAGRRNVEASILLAADRRANSKELSEKEVFLIAERQEKILKKYARKQKIWLKEEDISNKSLRHLPDGAECHVYLDEDGKHVIKVMNYLLMSKLPQDYLDNRISLHNYLFKDTKYELLGFTENGDGFAFVIRQLFIQGIELETETEEEDAIQREHLNAYMKEHLNMDYAWGNTYYNNDYIIDDLHLNNVLEDKTGNFYFIDTVPSLNTPDKKLGGKRKYGDNSIIDNNPSS